MWWGAINSYCQFFCVFELWRGANNKAEQIKSNWKAFCKYNRDGRLRWKRYWSSSSSHWLELNFNGFCFFIASVHLFICSVAVNIGVFNERRVCVCIQGFLHIFSYFYLLSFILLHLFSIFARHYFSILLLPNHWVDIRIWNSTFAFCISHIQAILIFFWANGRHASKHACMMWWVARRGFSWMNDMMTCISCCFFLSVSHVSQ